MTALNRRRNRILFILASPEAGGAQRVAARLCHHWSREGRTVRVIFLHPKGKETTGPGLAPEVGRQFLDQSEETRGTSFAATLGRLWRLRRAMVDFRPDAVIAFQTHVNLAVLLAGLATGLRILISERNYPPRVRLNPLYQGLRRLLYGLAARVVVQTEPGYEWIRRHCLFATPIVIGNPIPASQEADSVEKPKGVSADDLPAGRHLLLAAGRLVPQKGFDLLLEALADRLPRHPDWTLVILGEGGERPALERQVARLSLGGQVHLPGQVDNIGAWYARADLFVLSSRHEGLPNVLLEALADGVPAVSFDCLTGPRDLIDDGVNGLLVPMTAGSAGLGAAIESLMTDPARRARFGARAVDLHQRFSMDRIAGEWEALL